MNFFELTRTVPLDPKAVAAAGQFYAKISDIPRHENTIDDDDTLDFIADREFPYVMQQLGWTEAHTMGYYSNVFSKPGEPYVLKINKRVDRPYAWFAFLTIKFPNRHFSKICNAKIIKVNKENYRIYAIEKLQPMATQFNRDDAGEIASFCKWTARSPLSREFLLTQTKRDTHLCKILNGQVETLLDACMLLKKYNKGYHIDIHQNNMMLRDQTFVITDPYSVV
jgi:hypothetical protein